MLCFFKWISATYLVLLFFFNLFELISNCCCSISIKQLLTCLLSTALIPVRVAEVLHWSHFRLSLGERIDHQSITGLTEVTFISHAEVSQIQEAQVWYFFTDVWVNQIRYFQIISGLLLYVVLDHIFTWFLTMSEWNLLELENNGFYFHISLCTCAYCPVSSVSVCTQPIKKRATETGGQWRDEDVWDLLNIYRGTSVQVKLEGTQHNWAVFWWIAQFDWHKNYLVVFVNTILSITHPHIHTYRQFRTTN